MLTIAGDVLRKGAETSDPALVYQNAKPLNIEDLGSIAYPEGYLSPKVEPSDNRKSGRLRYERDFLLQFKPVCNVKPTTVFSLDTFGLDPVQYLEQINNLPKNSGARQRAIPQMSAGLGIDAGGASGQHRAWAWPVVGQSATIPSSEERRALASGQRATPGVGGAPLRPSPVASEGTQKVLKRQRTKRGRKLPPQVKGTGGECQSGPAPLAWKPDISSQRSLE